MVLSCMCIILLSICTNKEFSLHIVGWCVVKVTMVEKAPIPCWLLLPRFHTEALVVYGQCPFHRTKVVQNA